MFSFIFGLLLIGVAELASWLSGGSPTDGPWMVMGLVGGWFAFAPVRRAVARGERRPDPPRP